MDQKKEDLRVKRTKKAIKNAFLKCLESNTLEQTTVKEIVDLANCNRNTFYLHYEDKYDLMDKLCKEALQTLDHHLLNIYLHSNTSTSEYYMEISRVCLDLMEEDMQFYIIVLGMNKYPEFVDQYRQVIISYIFSTTKVTDVKSKKIETEYCTHGLIGVHRYWLMHHEEYNKTDILKFSKKLIIGLGKIIFEDEGM